LSSLSDILNAVADEKALMLLNTIATNSYESEELVQLLNLSRKEFYSRISRFIKAGLVRRISRRYSLTLFGMLVHEVKTIIEDALSSRWKFKALDELEISELPKYDREQIVNSLVGNEFIRKIYLQTHATHQRDP
jgi:DNA-binding Lrp family transcriptional regulator